MGDGLTIVTQMSSPLTSNETFMTAQSNVRQLEFLQNAMPFRDRTEAGRVLGGLLNEYANDPAVLVMALPRGGAAVAREVAAALNAELDVFLMRKLYVPHRPEVAMGVVACGGIRLLNHDAIGAHGISAAEIETVTGMEGEELERRAQAYRGSRANVEIAGRTVILIDDGLATGATMLVAVEAVRAAHPAKIVVSVPVAAAESLAALEREADRVVCAHTPTPFFGVAHGYRDFSPIMDREIRDMLQARTHRHVTAS